MKTNYREIINTPYWETGINGDKHCSNCGTYAEANEINRELTKAKKMLAQEYTKALNSNFVKKPMAYALHQVWTYFNLLESEVKE